MIVLILAATLVWSAPQENVVGLATPEESAAMAAAFAPNVPPTGGDWRVLTAGDGKSMAIDVAHIAAEGSLRTVWIAYAGGFSGGPPGAYALARLELDCTAGSARPLWFALRAATGASLYGFEPTEDFRAYEERSGGAAIATTACGGATPEGPAYPTHRAFAAAVNSAP